MSIESIVGGIVSIGLQVEVHRVCDIERVLVHRQVIEGAHRLTLTVHTLRTMRCRQRSVEPLFVTSVATHIAVDIAANSIHVISIHIPRLLAHCALVPAHGMVRHRGQTVSVPISIPSTIPCGVSM